MLKGIQDKNITVQCNNCGNEYQDPTDLPTPGKIKKYLKEYGEYENYTVTCPTCGTIEIFNMNIPVNETDEPFETGDLPEKEEIQRYYVRLLQRMVREDFVSLTQ